MIQYSDFLTARPTGGSSATRMKPSVPGRAGVLDAHHDVAASGGFAAYSLTRRRSTFCSQLPAVSSALSLSRGIGPEFLVVGPPAAELARLAADGDLGRGGVGLFEARADRARSASLSRFEIAQRRRP